MKSVIKSLTLLTAAIAFLIASPVRADLLVQYTFDEASSGTTNALNTGTLGSAADGVFNGAATRTNDTPGGVSLGALNLNPQGGNSEFVGPPATSATSVSPSLTGLSDITVSTWLNVQGGAPSYSILGEVQNTSGSTGWAFYFEGGGSAVNLQFQIGLTAKPATANVNASDTWVFVAVTWDHSTGDLNFYSGTPTSAVTQVGSTVAYAATMTSNNTNALRVGANPSSGVGGHIPNAFLDDFRIYNSALDQTALNGVRLQGITTPEPASGMMLLLSSGGLLLRRRRA